MEGSKKQAAGLENAAREIRSESKRLKGCREDLMHAWQGDNAARLGGKISRICEDLDNTAARLERAAETIRRSVKGSQ